MLRQIAQDTYLVMSSHTNYFFLGRDAITVAYALNPPFLKPSALEVKTLQERASELKEQREDVLERDDLGEFLAMHLGIISRPIQAGYVIGSYYLKNRLRRKRMRT